MTWPRLLKGRGKESLANFWFYGQFWGVITFDNLASLPRWKHCLRQDQSYLPTLSPAFSLSLRNKEWKLKEVDAEPNKGNKDSKNKKNNVVEFGGISQFWKEDKCS